MTSGDESPELTRAAEAVSDGVPLDAEAKRVEDGEREVLENLRAIETIARVHREAAAEVSRPGAVETAAAQSESGAAGTASAGPPPGSHEKWGALLLLERIAGGSFGDVYRAWDPSLEREVALKLFRAGGPGGETGRFLEEARRLARMRHPNVVVVHGVDEHEGRVGVWTDLLRGRTLAEWLAEHGPLGASEAALIGMELCRALAAVHGAGLVHRDVKAENVVREKGGRLVLLDFGAADSPAPTPLERFERGTPITMAPEQLEGGAVGPAADIYGLGVLLYRLVSGHYPIEAENLPDLRERHRTGTSVRLRDRRADLPAEFVSVVEKALARVPAQRYASAGEMERALAAVAGASLPASPVTGGASGPWRIGVAVFVASAAIIGVMYAGHIGPFGGQGRNAAPGTRAAERAGAPEGGAGRTAAGNPAPGAEARAPSAEVPVTATAAVFADRATGPVRLQGGDQVAPGDALYLRIRSADSIYVYVLDEDERGGLFALFPVPGANPGNPLPGGAEHRLPGSLDGKPFDWQVTNAGGREDICVIAARAPIAALESELARFPHARPGAPVSYGRISRDAANRLRGLGGMIEATGPASQTPRRIGDLVRSLQSRRSAGDEPWIWELTLENPGREK